MGNERVYPALGQKFKEFVPGKCRHQGIESRGPRQDDQLQCKTEEVTTTEQDAIRIASGNVKAYNSEDWGRLKAAPFPDVTSDEMGGQRKLHGAAAFAKAYQGWKEARPDGKGAITNAFAAANTALIEVTWMVTNTRPLGSNLPTGKGWNVRGTQVVVLEGNKIKELQEYFDMKTIMQRLSK